MANTSIYAAFERMWQHVVAAVGSKADASHTHDDIYYTETEVDGKINEAKSYADAIKEDLLNGAGAAYDTLKELGDLIDENQDAIDALEIVAAGKADAEHTHDDRYYTEAEIDLKLVDKANSSHSHEISDIANLQTELDGKSSSDHTHSYSDVEAITYGVNRIAITANSDLNDITTVGCYKYVSTGTVNTLSNCPATEAFTMDVVSATGSSSSVSGVYKYILQKITSASGKMYIREIYTDSNANDITYLEWSKIYADNNKPTATDIGAQPIITGGASTIASSNLAANRVLVSDSSGKVVVSAVDTTELAMLDGISSSVQGQLNNKAEVSELIAHKNNVNNPHNVTLANLGVTATVTELNYVDGVTSNVQAQLNAKVDAVSGKGLSTNDYTTEEKTKLEALPDNTQAGQLVAFIEYTEDEIQSLWDSVVV